MAAPVRIGTCSFADEALVKHWYPRGRAGAASGSPTTPSASRRSRSTRPSTACRPRRRCRAGPTARPAGFVMHVKAFGLMTRHPVQLEQLPPDLRDGMPVDERGRVDRPSREAARARLRRVPRARSSRSASAGQARRDPLPAAALRRLPKPSSLRLPRVGARAARRRPRCSSSSATAPGSRRTRAPSCSRWLEEQRMSYVTVDAPRLDAANVPRPLVAVDGADSPTSASTAATPAPGTAAAAAPPQRFDYLYGADELARVGRAPARARGRRRRAPTRSSTTTTRPTASPRPRRAPSSCAACSREQEVAVA